MSVILVGDIAVGMIQVSPADPRHAVGPDACAIDLLIGDPRWIGRGLGPQVIDQFVTLEIFARSDLATCVADPHEENTRSIRAFEKAGFVSRSRFQEAGEPFVLMSRSRAAPSA